MTKKLIIIDDSQTQLNILKTFFASNGWEVHGAKSACCGWEMIFDFAPDLIITDAIMPNMGGFQLVKNIRENSKLSKIPIIVYSILNETNAKFYVREELSEYFLRKENNHDELLSLAEKTIQKFPLDEEYKLNILKTRFEHLEKKEESKDFLNEQIQKNDEKKETEIEIKQKEPINKEELELSFREKYDFSYSDDKIMSDIFSILYKILEYDLFVVSIFSFENHEQKVYFDIRDIILSPILRNSILNKYSAQNNILYKKYAPNLKMITNEDEFYSKVEFVFEYKDKIIAQCAFYSQEKNKWENIEDIEAVRDVLNNFFKARHINKSVILNKKDVVGNKYFSQANRFDVSKNFQNSYFAIFQIANFSDLSGALLPEEFDVVNSKISEKIIEYLEKDEQVFKNDEDEYDVVIFAKDEKQAIYKLNYILNALEGISYNSYNVEVLVGASCLNIDDTFNIFEAQKKARIALDSASRTEKVVI